MMHIAAPQSLDWIAPPGMDPGRFIEVQMQLSSALDNGEAEEVYRIDHRSVYKLESQLGSVAVKEVRHKRILQRFKLRYAKQAKAVREFYTTAEFAGRGGVVPELFAMGLRQNVFGLSKVFVFMRWIEGSMTLRDHTHDAGGRLPVETWKTIVNVLLDSAKKGLVHGGHSPENILIVEKESGVEVTVIDLAESVLHDALDEEGYINDVVRIIRSYSSKPSRCSIENLYDFIRVVAESTWQDAETQRSRMFDIASRAELSTEGL